MLAPLSAGKHTIRFTVEGCRDISYNLTAQSVCLSQIKRNCEIYNGLPGGLTDIDRRRRRFAMLAFSIPAEAQEVRGLNCAFRSLRSFFRTSRREV
jgi:hypothetical protein